MEGRDKESIKSIIHKPEEIGEESRDLWVIPYGNLMTILMIFFLLLYAYTNIGTNIRYEEVIGKIQSQLGGRKETLEETEVANKLDKYLSEQGLQSFAQVEIDAQRIKIMFTSPVLFDLGESRLKKDAIDILRGVAQLINEIPNPVVVEGHTDNIPIVGGKYRSNWELSASRAFSVVEYFIKEQNLDPEKFSAFGYGEYRPLYPNDTPENKARNRRIEISIYRM